MVRVFSVKYVFIWPSVDPHRGMKIANITFAEREVERLTKVGKNTAYVPIVNNNPGDRFGHVRGHISSLEPIQPRL